jgi:hypothetical protein
MVSVTITTGQRGRDDLLALQAGTKLTLVLAWETELGKRHPDLDHQWILVLERCEDIKDNWSVSSKLADGDGDFMATKEALYSLMVNNKVTQVGCAVKRTGRFPNGQAYCVVVLDSPKEGQTMAKENAHRLVDGTKDAAVGGAGLAITGLKKIWGGVVGVKNFGGDVVEVTKRRKAQSKNS